MPKLLTVSLSLIAATIALTGCNREVPDTHPDQPVTKRRALFKEFTRTLEPMGLVSRDRQPYKADKFLEQAQALKKLSTQPWPLFTPDSNYPPTTASPKVWQQAEAFKQAQTQFLQAVDDLNQAAAGTDLDRIKTTVNDVQKACKACHDTFRNEKLL
ncbi:MAG TPA: cytochrome c [Burkholderiaceae bacterium]|nr:cytochrome c [Burkholderiaceae bacterium]